MNLRRRGKLQRRTSGVRTRYPAHAGRSDRPEYRLGCRESERDCGPRRTIPLGSSYFTFTDHLGILVCTRRLPQPLVAKKKLLIAFELPSKSLPNLARPTIV